MSVIIVAQPSESAVDLSQALHPKTLGPIFLGQGRTANNLALAMEYSHVYADQLGALGLPTEDWAEWSSIGRTDGISKYATRRNVKESAFVYWEGKKYSREDAEKLVFKPLYQKMVLRHYFYTELEHQYHRDYKNILLYTPSPSWHIDAIVELLEKSV